MDGITKSFLATQLDEAMAMAASSDLVRLAVIGGPELLVAEFRCRGLVRSVAGNIEEADHFVVGFHFAADYLRRVRPPEVLTWIEPASIWHPNIGGPRSPTGICIGNITPATPLVDLLYRVYELISWQSFTPVEYDALNIDACSWARANLHRFPIDGRPLRWRGSLADPAFMPDPALPGSLLDSMEIVG